MEQYLAVKRAELSGKEELIQRALKAHDPVKAKHVLNALHGDHQEQWDKQLEQLVMEGLRAKFKQNAHLQDYLCSTGNLILGEASTNLRWGIGMDLNNPKVLDQSQWLESGNLLGRSLMKLRAELCQKKRAPTSRGQKKQCGETGSKDTPRNT